MKKSIPLILFFCIFSSLGIFSQTVNITGTIFDEGTKEAIEMASVRVLNVKDSSYVAGGVTNEKGRFSVAVKSGQYITHISFIGYLEQYYKVNTSQKTSVGDVFLKEDGILLKEAIVEAKAPEIIVKGDTVEYNADSYKVQESAVLGDLIKKIPGAEIDADGKITVNGKDISKILVDGKDFFSTDPKTASENLPARMIEKLQVLDQKSDMALLTGFDDGEEQTVINLIVKPGMKEGVMANLSGGYGNKDRYESNGFVNIAKNDNRLSALGNFNNTNNVNSGMGGGRRWGGDRGLTETTMGGVNIAMEPSKKFKYDGDIQYRGTDNNVESTTSTEYTSKGIGEEETSTQNNNNKNLSGRFKFEWNPNEKTSIIFRPNVSYSKSSKFSLKETDRVNQSDSQEDFSAESESASNGHSLNLNGNLLINRKLSEKGRSVTLELSGGITDGSTDGSTYTATDYYNSGLSELLNQVYNQKNDNNNWRARVSYLEPVGTGNFLELAYNIKNTHSETDKKTYDIDASKNQTLSENYTRTTKNDFLNQNVSLSFQSRRQKYNYTIGVGLEPSRSQTSVEKPNEEQNRYAARNFLNFAPRLEFNYLWDKRHNLRLRYNGETIQPTTDQLFDGSFSNEGNNEVVGNPNLEPGFQHRLNIRYQKYTAEKASSIMGFANFTYATNDITSISSFEGNKRITTYENIDGNMTGRLMMMYNTPLRNKSFSINARTSGNYNRDNTFITAQNGGDPTKNTANTYSIGEGLRLKFNTDKFLINKMWGIEDAFTFNIGTNFTYENTRNSALSAQNNNIKNQEIYNYGGGADLQWFLPLRFVLESDVNYSSNSGYEGGYKENSWVWNASLAKEFNIKIKSKENVTTLPATLNFKIYDILQQRSNISRSSNAERISYSTYNTISSYFMVGLTIRFQSFKGGAKQSDFDEGGGERFRGRGPGGGGRRSGGPGGMF